MQIKVTMYNMCSGAIRWQTPVLLSDGLVMFALSLTVCEIFTKQAKGRNFDLEDKGQGRGAEERTCAIRLVMIDSILVIFFSEF